MMRIDTESKEYVHILNLMDDKVLLEIVDNYDGYYITLTK